LVDLWNMSSTCSQKVDVNIEEYLEALPNSELEVLALKAGIFSRFNIDPKFSKEQYENLYKQWIINSTNKKIADAVFVAREGCKIVGMITVGRKNCRGNIGLISVDENRRGQNMGVSLVSTAHKWFISQGCKIAQVVTQTDNIAACRLYNKCGYHIERTEHFYHFWL
jgi:dTDP-4-amino-4,6-dideoxy-D-galactose acyltransferase